MGKAARPKIKGHFAVAHYEERMINLYWLLVGARPGD
jgi:hypothetical protein